MEKPTTIIVDNCEFYLADDLQKYASDYFVGCAKTVRQIIEKKNIPKTKYKYLTHKKTGYENSTEEYKKAKLALSKEWVEKNIPVMSNGLIKEEFDKEPSKIKFDKKELMVIDNDVMDIAIVGQREYNKCYFRVKEVSEYFESPNLQKTITDPKYDGYIEGKHYKYFIRKTFGSSKKDTNKKVLYLTYCGMIRFLFTSRNKKAEAFQDWAANILFTHQVGTPEQKKKLIKELGTDATNAIEVFNTSVNELSCVYLFVIDIVEKLRESMKIPETYDNTSYVCKYGETKDLKRRTQEHMATYSKYTDDVKLKFHVRIDSNNTFTAESALRKRFDEMNVRCELVGQDEIVILSKQQFDSVQLIYRDLGILYGAQISEYKSQTEKEIVSLQNTIELQKQDIKLRDKDIEMKNKELDNKKIIDEYKEKELLTEIEKLKKELSKYKKKK